MLHFRHINILSQRMDPQSLTDAKIRSLLACAKKVLNPRAREARKAKHQERNYELRSLDDVHSFTLILRQNVLIDADFSCGLLWHASNTQKVMLARYNGWSHPHDNPIEQERFEDKCHIHTATQRYIELGKKVEHYAESTERYEDLRGALSCLKSDCNVLGLPFLDTDPQRGLFE